MSFGNTEARKKNNPLTLMLRDDDEFEPEYDCPICSRSFGAHSRLEDHIHEEHAPERRCRNCGKLLQPQEFHRC